MKYLIVSVLFLAQVAHAVELARIHSDPEVSSRVRYIISDKEIKLKKESNLFDEKKDLTLGTFKLVPSKKFSSNRLNAIRDEIKRADEFLKKKGSSFNELSSTKEHHKPFITIDDFRILEGSNYYAELDKTLKELSSLPREQLTGMLLSSDLKKVSYIKDGKMTKTDPFNIKFSCKNEAAPTVCYFKGEGFLILR